MIREIYALIIERLEGARLAPDSACKSCAVEELEEVLEIIREIADYYDEPLGEDGGGGLS